MVLEFFEKNSCFLFNKNIKLTSRDLPGVPVAKNPTASAGAVGSIPHDPGRGSGKIPLA